MNGKFGNGIIFDDSHAFTMPPLQFGDTLLYQVGENIMEQNGEIYEHPQICHEISSVVSGEADFYSDDEVHHLKKGSIHVIPKGKKHRIIVKSHSQFRYYYLGFGLVKHEESTITDLLSGFFESDIMHGADNGTITQLFNQIVKLINVDDALSYDTYRAYLKLILIAVYRLFNKENHENTNTALVTNSSCCTIFHIIKCIDNNISSITKVAEISDMLNYSPSYISRIFKKKMGITVQEYISTKKIEEAVVLLKTKKYSINDVAEHLGFDSYRVFFNSFKRHMGCSPSEFVKKL